MVNKPRRRKDYKFPWLKVAAVGVGVLVVAAGAWVVYYTFIFKPAPIFARVDTSLGSFDVELYPACAPQTVANFVSLANAGFYDNLTWHRIVKTSTFWIIQTGDPTSRGGLNSTRASWGLGGSNTTVPLEWCGWLHNYAGTLAMARLSSSVNSGTSQFYVNVANLTGNEGLDGNYTVFGKVISGMSVVTALGNSPICRPPTCPSTWQADEPLPPVFVRDIVILGASPLNVSSTSVS